MGRKACWTSETLAVVQAHVEAGRGPAAIKRLHPELALNTLKRWVPKLRRGETTRFQGARSRFSGAVGERVRDLAGAGESLLSIRQTLLAEFELQVSRSGISKFLHGKLNMRSVKKVRTFRISPVNKEKRLQFAHRLLPRLAIGRSRVRRRGKTVPGIDLNTICFSDEKVFKINGSVRENGQNARCWIEGEKGSKRRRLQQGDETLRTGKPQNSAGVMVGLVVSIAGKILEPCFVPPGVKVNSTEYISMLENVYCPYFAKNEAIMKYGHFQDDNAPSHSAGKTKEWQKLHMPIPSLPGGWPASSPDLSPLDYGLWDRIVREMTMAGHTEFPNVTSLKLAIAQAIAVLNGEQWHEVEKILKAFPGKLRKVIESGGGHFEA